MPQIVWIVSASIVIYLLAIIIGLRMVRLTSWRLEWIILIAVMLLMVVRRSIQLAAYAGGEPVFSSDIISEWISLLVAALLVAGLAFASRVYITIQRTQAALVESEARYRSLFELSGVAILAMSPPGWKITKANQAACNLTGRSAEELLQMNGPDLIAAGLRDDVRQKWDEQLTASGMFSIQSELELARDERRPVLMTGKLLHVDREISLQVVIQNLTERNQAAREIERKTAQLKALYDFGLDLASQSEQMVLLRSVVARAIQLVDGVSGGLYLYRPDEDVLEWAMTVGEGLSIVGTKLRRGEGLSGKVWESGQAAHVDDYEHWEGRAPIYDGMHFKALIAVPVRWGDHLLGVLNILADPPRLFVQQDVELLEQFALQAAITLHNFNQLEETRQRVREQELLNEITRATLEQNDMKSMLQTLADRLGELFGADGCYMTVWDEARQLPIPTAAYGVLRDVYPNTVVIEHETNLTESALRARQPLLVEDARDSPYISPRISAQFPAVSAMALPLFAGEEKLGAAIIAYNQPHKFSPMAVQLGFQASRQLSLAVLKARLLEIGRHDAFILEQRVGKRTAELHAANTRLAETARRLEEVNQELKSFSFTVSHDLRAPLRAMQGYALALQEDHAASLGASGVDYINRMLVAARRMDRQIVDLLEYSQLTRMEIQLGPVSLAACVEAAISRLDVEISSRQAQVETVLPLPQVLAHRATLEQVLTNLIANAITFVDPGSTPNVKIYAGGQPLSLAPQADPGDQFIRLWVEDNGIGIGSQHFERIFKVFERLHGVETYPGTGIGLAIVYKGVERMGGRVGVESHPGNGSKFWIELPLVVEARQEHPGSPVFLR